MVNLRIRAVVREPNPSEGLGKPPLLMVLILVVGLIGGIAHVASAQVITDIERHNSSNTPPQIAGPLVEDALVFVDRPHIYVNVPSFLVGIDYVKVANDDKYSPNYELDVTVGEDATLMLFIDDRVGDDDNTNPPTIGSGVMNWVAGMGFVDTGLQIDIDEYPATDPDIDQYFSIYSLEVMAGTTVTLLEQNDGTARNMYGVAAVQGTLNLPPVVDAGDAQVIIWPENAVQLDATVTDDGKPVSPGKVTLMWSVQSSPDGSTVQFDPNEFVEDPAATFDEAGTYVLCLTADDSLLSESDYVTIAVKEPDCPVGDLSGDGQVDWQDLQVFAGQWLDMDPLGEGLVSHWRLDGNADDPVGGNHGTVNGNPVWTIGKVDGALYFDGDGDYVHCGNDSSLNLTNNFSISVWFKIDSACAIGTIVCKGNVPAYQSDGAYTIFCNLVNGEVGFYVRKSNNNGSDGVKTAVTVNEWTHVVGTFSDGNISIYRDGGLPDEDTLGTSTINTNDGPLGIGAEGDGGVPCIGIIDDVRIYGRVLSEAEIGEIANLGASDPNCADLNGDSVVNLTDFAWLGDNWAKKGSLLESAALRIILTRNPYSFTIIEKSSGRTLLSQQETTFELGGSSYTAESAYNITTTASMMDADLVLAGALAPGHVRFSLESPDVVGVLLTCSGDVPSNIKEEFIDQGEHYYGIWEYPRGGNIDNRGANHDLIGFGGMPNTNYANARAPFYVTSGEYGIYVDTVSLGHYSVAIDGKTSFDFDEEQLTYYVLYGPDYGNIFNTFNNLAGPAWMPPDWAFDSVWWRDNDHADLGHWDIVEGRTINSAQRNVEATANHLRYYKIPASAIWIDRPYTSGTWGWGNMDFNPAGDWFPDGNPNGQAMIDYLENKGYHLLLWIANRCANELYTEGSALDYLFGGDRSAADVRRPEVYAWFKDKLDTFASMGVRGYKVDRGHEGEQPDAAENEVVYLFRKLAAEGQMDRHGSDYLIHARNCYDKNRRHIGVWNGDTQSNFGGLSVSIKNGLRCGAINFPYYGSDTGGYLSDYPSQELFTRWFQFSTYCTMMETLIDPHRTVWYDEDFPHNAEPNLIDIARKQCSDHHDLIPYTKSCMYTAHQTGMPVMRQLIFAYPDDSSLYDMWDEYLYGPEILVAPVVTAGATSRSVYLPAGKWLDYNNRSTVYTGTTTITASAPIDVIPLFVREGAVITRGDILRSNNNWTPGWAPYLRIEFFPYDNTANTFDYYTGSNVRPIACSMSDINNVDISFLDLGYGGTLDIYCRAYTNVTKNDIPLVEGVDFTYDPVKNLLTIPFSGVTTVEITGVTSIFEVD